MSEKIFLPQVTINTGKNLPPETHLLLLGGRPPQKEGLAALLAAQKKRPTFWAVDRGVDICRENLLAPELLIGDADSASTAGWAWGQQTAAVTERHPTEKDLTDTELALARTASKDTLVLLTGAFGGRFDHAFSTVFSTAYDLHICILADEKEILLFVKSGESVMLDFTHRPLAISTLPLTETVTGVTLRGTHWTLTSATLTQKLPSAVSNMLEAGSHTLTVQCETGILGIELIF